MLRAVSRSRAAFPALARAAVPVQRRTFISGSEDYGKHVFKGAIADSCVPPHCEHSLELPTPGDARADPIGLTSLRSGREVRAIGPCWSWRRWAGPRSISLPQHCSEIFPPLPDQISGQAGPACGPAQRPVVDQDLL